jgi:hypothetical protein
MMAIILDLGLLWLVAFGFVVLGAGIMNLIDAVGDRKSKKLLADLEKLKTDHR